MEGSSRAGQLTVWEGDTGKENVGQGVRSEKRKRESSSYLGVSWVERLGKYRARCCNLYLGCFDDEVEAAEAYNAKARELKGEKAKLNVFSADEKAHLAAVLNWRASQRDTLLIECHVACSSPRDTPLHARATVTLPTRPVGR